MLNENIMAERLEMIKAIAAKAIAKKARVAAIKAKSARVVGWVDDNSGVTMKKPTQNLTEKHDGESELHWTDASKFAKQYYGEVHYHTTKLDNDWGDY